MLGHGYSEAIVTCAAAPRLALPLVLLSKGRDSDLNRQSSITEAEPAAAP
jgi:hypothetical protein